MLLNGAKFCPFCGNDVIKSDLIDGELRAWCVNCLAVGPTRHFGPDGTAAGAWGDRAVDDGAAEQRAEAAEREVARLRALIADEAAELPVWPADAYQTPAERDVSGVRARLLAEVAEAQPGPAAGGAR